MSLIRSAYINALLADASYVDGLVPGTVRPSDFTLRLTTAQATYLAANFTVVSSNQSTGGGFDAIVWQVKAGSEVAGPNNQDAGRIFVSMRGTQEFQDFLDDASLAGRGIPYEQVRDMVNWWLKNTAAVTNTEVKQIKVHEVPGMIGLKTFALDTPTTGTGLLTELDGIAGVNGHSLGGYLATAFTRIFGSAWGVEKVSTFNSAGFSNAAGVNIAIEYNNIASLLGGSMGIPFGGVAGLQSNFLGSNGINFTTNSAADIGIPGFNQYGQRVGLYQEDLLTGGATAPINNHSMYKLTDYLALGAALEKLDSSLTFSKLDALVKAGSNDMAASYEGVFDGVRKALAGASIERLPIGDLSGNADSRATFHATLAAFQDNPIVKGLEGQLIIRAASADLRAAARNDFGALAALHDLSPVWITGRDAAADALLTTVWQTTRVDAYAAWQADKNLSQAERLAGKESYTDSWLADRAVLIGAIDARNTKDGNGLAYSSALPTDRAYDLRWTDASGAEQILIAENTARQGGLLTPIALQRFAFGNDGNNTLTGSDINKLGDHLYGGEGNDDINANAGNDYLEGNTGNDTLKGGEGQDILLGGTGNDTLDGGKDNDILKGGSGTDTYTLRASDSGIDTITDSDGLGSIKVITTDGSEITLGNSTLTKLASGPNNTGTWQSEDKRFTYTTRAEADGSQTLSISGGGVSTVVQNFSSGNLGITLPGSAPSEEDPTTARQILGDREAVDFNGAEEGIQGQPDELGNIIVDAEQVKPNQADNLFDSADDDEIIAGGGNDRVQATRGGNNWIDAGSGHDTVYAGVGDDLLELGDGNDYGYAGAGDDRLFAGSQTPLDEILKQTEASAATETLDGGSGNDTLVGEAGHDTLYGGAGSDLMIGGAGEDRMHGDLGGLQDQPAGVQGAGQAGHTVSRIPLRRHQPAQGAGGRHASGRRNSPGTQNHHGISAQPGAEGVG